MDSKEIKGNVLPKLEKEISEIERKIKKNESSKFVKNLKVGAMKLLDKSPFLLVTYGVYSLFSALGPTPFVMDKWEVNPHYKNEFDSLGNKEYIEQYDEFSSEEKDVKSMLSYYSAWEYNNKDNSYTQTIKQYDINGKTFEDVEKLFDKSEITLNDVLGEPLTVKKVSKTNLSEKEKNKDAYFKGVIYDINKNTCKVFEENVVDNIVSSAFFVLIAVLANGTIGLGSYAIIEEIFDEHMRNKSEKLEELKEKLDERKKVYEKIKG